MTVCTFIHLEWFFTYQLVLFALFYVVPVSLISAFYVLLAVTLRNQLPNGAIQEAPQVTRAARIVVGFVISFFVLSTPLQVEFLWRKKGRHKTNRLTNVDHVLIDGNR